MVSLVRPRTQRAARWIHSWSGILCGLILFLIFTAGTLTLYADALNRWSQPAATPRPVDTPAQVQAFAEAIHRSHPELKGCFSLVLPTQEEPNTGAYWLDSARGRWVFTDREALARHKAPGGQTGLGEFLNELHHNLGLGQRGALFLGAICLLYALAVLTGVLIHLPRGRQMLTIARQQGPRRLWGDLHAVLGFISLPFHLIFALTGALFCFFMVLVMAYDRPAFHGHLSSHLDAILGTATPEPSGQPGPPLSMEALQGAARQAAPGLEPRYLRLSHYGDATGSAQVMGYGHGQVGIFGVLSLDLSTGRPLEIQTPGHRDTNHAVMSTLYGLHFGHWGGPLVRALYFLLGLLGALILLAGQVVWVAARWKRPGGAGQARFMARLTVGFCGGVILGVAVAFPASRLGMNALPWAFWGTLGLSVLGCLVGSLKTRVRLISLLATVFLFLAALLRNQGLPQVSAGTALAGLLILILRHRMSIAIRDPWA
nr:PepSY-associated TM helix domain-containing protein [uncultured Holophaga sp.]